MLHICLDTQTCYIFARYLRRGYLTELETLNSSRSLMMDAYIAIVTCHESMSLSHNCDGSFLYFICSVRTHVVFTTKA